MAAVTTYAMTEASAASDAGVSAAVPLSAGLRTSVDAEERCLGSGEQLKGDRADQWSLRVNDQFRIGIRWTEDDAEVVEIVDHH
jgi:hypothetical protein